jgi:probable phosphoglycerate mutase
LETAKIVAAPHELPVMTSEGLAEVNFGSWTGESLEQLRQRKLWHAVQFTPSTVRYPNGESPREMQARVAAEIEGLRAQHSQQTVVVVSHADVIKAAVAFYVGLPLDLFQRLVVGSASLTILKLDGPVPRLVCLNDTGHLSSIVGEGERRTCQN